MSVCSQADGGGNGSLPNEAEDPRSQHPVRRKQQQVNQYQVKMLKNQHFLFV